MSTDVLARLHEVLPDVVGEPGTAGTAAPARRRLVAGVSPALTATFALFLPFAIAKVQWAYPDLDIPYLPRVLGTLAVLIAAFTIPTTDWRESWRNPTFRAVTAIVALSIITIPIAFWPLGSWTTWTGDLWKSFTIFFVGAYVFRDRKALRRNLALTLIGVAAVAVFALSGNAKTVGEEGRVIIGGYDPNDLAAMFVACLPLTFWMARGGVLRWVLWHSVAVLLALAVIPTASRGGMLGLVAVGASLLVFSSNWGRRFLVLGLLIVGILGFEATATPLQRARFNTIFTPGSDYNTTGTQGRWFFWKTGIKWMLLRPTGLGVNGFRYKWDWVMGGERVAHNSFVQIGADLGVLGLAALSMAFGQTMLRCRTIRRNARRAAASKKALARDEIALVESGLTALVGLGVTGFFLAFGYHPVTYFILAIGAGITYGSPFQSAEPPPGTPEAGKVRKAVGHREPGWRSARVGIPATMTNGKM